MIKASFIFFPPFPLSSSLTFLLHQTHSLTHSLSHRHQYILKQRMRNDRIIQYTAHTGTTGELILDIKMNYSWEANTEYVVCSLICHNMNILKVSSTSWTLRSAETICKDPQCIFFSHLQTITEHFQRCCESSRLNIWWRNEYNAHALLSKNLMFLLKSR